MDEDRRLTEAVCRDIAGRQRYLGGPQPLAEAVAQLMASRGYARVQSAAELDQVWNDAVGQTLAANSRPGNLRRGVLEVIVANSAVMQELEFIKRKILKELTTLTPKKIRNLRFRVGPVDATE
jgi:hypothetical protein